jgi:DNA ligase-1
MILSDSSPKSVPAGVFSVFAETAEQLGRTTKRLEKAALLARYFGALSDQDLAIAARYFAGHIFPLRDQRTTNVGGATLFRALENVTGENSELLAKRLVHYGDLGDLTAEVFAGGAVTSANQGDLTLDKVAAALEGLAETAGSKKKLELITELLRGASPLEAKYLVKILSGDLRIGLKEGAVEDALARMFGAEVKQVQWANMLTGDIGSTAMLARHRRLGEARMQLFHPIKFMLATPAEDLSDVAEQMPEEFAVEDKFDGIRVQAHVAPAEAGEDISHGILHEGENGRTRVALFSRTLDEITRSFPDLIAPLSRLIDANRENRSAGLILDGEIVPVSGKRILPFLQLQKRLGRKTLSEELRAAVPVAFIAYDALYRGEQVLIDESFTTRRAALESLQFDGAAVRLTDSILLTDVTQLDGEFTDARARGNEGLMIKDPRSKYKPGRRGREWLKLKRALATLDVVVTAVEVGNGRRSRFLSDYTFAVRASESDPTLLNVGKAYSGLTDAEIEALSDWFRAHTLREFAHGKVRVVEPKIVIEVTFDLVQRSNRHKSGYALRFPRILRIRGDKPAEEIDTLATVKRLAGEEKVDTQTAE